MRTSHLLSDFRLNSLRLIFFDRLDVREVSRKIEARLSFCQFRYLNSYGFLRRTGILGYADGQQAGLRQKFIRPAGREGDYGRGIVLDILRDLMRPAQTTLVEARVQSGCHHPSYQPSPCLRFHNLNPLCQIDETHRNRLAKERHNEAGNLFQFFPQRGCICS